MSATLKAGVRTPVLKSMPISKDQLEEGLNAALEVQIEKQAKQSEMVRMFLGSCEHDDQPDYELLRKHIEIWAQRHPDEMAAFFEYKKKVLNANNNDYGSSDSMDTRQLGAMPPGLYSLLCILSPNFLGAKELTAEERIKKNRTFYRKFPAFSLCKKI